MVGSRGRQAREETRARSRGVMEPDTLYGLTEQVNSWGFISGASRSRRSLLSGERDSFIHHSFIHIFNRSLWQSREKELQGEIGMEAE